MDAMHNGVTWSRRRFTAVVISVMAAALLAGGWGGYLARGASTLIVTHTVSAPPAAPGSEAQPYFGTARTSAGFIPGL